MMRERDDGMETTDAEKGETAPSPVQRTKQEVQRPIAPPTIRKMERDSAQTKPFTHMQIKAKIIPEGRQGQLNTQYLATVPGILKICEIILGFVAFILAICADRRSTSSAWTEHITFETAIIVCVLTLLYVVFPHLTLNDERTREGLIVVELLFYGLNTLFFFIGIWLMVHLAASWTAEGRGAALMNAILCLALCILYAMETFLKFKAWSYPSMNHGHNHQSRYQAAPAPAQHYSIADERFEKDGKGELPV